MATVIIVGGLNHTPYQAENCDYIAVDYGTQICIDHNIKPIITIGDFDSSNQIDFKDINLKIYPTEKDETDLELAILYALEKYDRIILTCCVGGRLDHTLYNLKLVERFNVEIYDQDHHVFKLGVGTYQIPNLAKYFSFFALEKSKLSLNGFKYPVNNEVFDVQDLKTISNEIEYEFGEIEIEYGQILCIQCN